jgi:predicted O-methyltransferase YrrM
VDLSNVKKVFDSNLSFPFIGSDFGNLFGHDSIEYLTLTINCRRSKNLNDVLNQLLDSIEGDVIEIGALTGTSTKVFCEVASKFDRQVYVIDPWNGSEAGSESMYDSFVKRTSKYSNLNVIRESSASQLAIDSMRDKKISFCLVDGLHTFEAAYYDLINYCDLITPGGLICLDDINLPEVRAAAAEFLRVRPEWQMLEIEDHIETFFSKRRE